jgi:hypothetical protein
MARVATSGRTVRIMKVTLWTANSREKVSGFWLIFVGVYFFAESDKTYEGQFVGNQFNGQGRLTYKDGRRYEGSFKSGKKHG